MKQTRRNFIIGTGAALVGSALEQIGADVVPTNAAPDIRPMLEAAGFDPDNPNSALMAVVADLHINQNPDHPKFTSRFDNRLVDELNSLSPAITDLAIAGDLIEYLSDVIGGDRYPHGYAWALQEFQVAKEQMTRFRADMRLYAVPGNHDTDRFEEDAETWRAQLTIPPYQKRVLGGVPVFFLNSGHAGLLNSAQAQWFENEAASIPADQEILIIAHHPSFFHFLMEAGLKRSVARVFRKHRAPVWVVGGHGHFFSEALYVSPYGTRFIQMEVTTGNPIKGGDGKSPGYILLALQDGKVIHRSFRSIIGASFQIRKPHLELQPQPLRFPFDTINYPAAVFEEGFYDRNGRLVEAIGIDLKSHFIQCRTYAVRAELGSVRGKISEFLLAADVPAGIAPPICQFSATGPDGPWMEAPFPPANYQQIYRIPVPLVYRNAHILYVRIRTQQQGSWDGIAISGWGFAADPAKLTEFEKWLSRHYRDLSNVGPGAPMVKPEGSTLTNLEHFAYNIPLPPGVSQSPVAAALPPGPLISTLPIYSQTFRSVMDFRFARRTASAESSITYAVEYSTDMENWSEVEEGSLAITPLEEGWEEARFVKALNPDTRGFCRVRVSAIPGSSTTSPVPTGDQDRNGIDDLLQYAFDIRLENGKPLSYDPSRSDHKTGMPVFSTQSMLVSRLVFPRMKSSVNPGVSYWIEQSSDLNQWRKVPTSLISERVIQSNGDWDEVESILMDAGHRRMFYRVCLEPMTGSPA